MAEIFVISPHLDDAVLSCGLRILRHVAAGDSVSVVTIFGEGNGYEARRAEDIAACEALGAKAVHLGFPDAPFRNDRYRNIEQIVFGARDEADLACATDIARALEREIVRTGGDVIYAPLAAGTHIDHRLTWDAVWLLKNATQKVLFYEDRPYARWPGILQTRMNAIGAVCDLPAVEPLAMERAIDDYFFLRSFVPDGAVRTECLPLYIKALRDSREVKKNRFIATCDTITARADEMECVWQALSLYKSQMSFLYASEDGFIKECGDQYEERCWSLTAVKA